MNAQELTEYEERIKGLLAACDKRQLAVMLLEARSDAEACKAQLAEAREQLEEKTRRLNAWASQIGTGSDCKRCGRFYLHRTGCYPCQLAEARELLALAKPPSEQRADGAWTNIGTRWEARRDALLDALAGGRE